LRAVCYVSVTQLLRWTILSKYCLFMWLRHAYFVTERFRRTGPEIVKLLDVASTLVISCSPCPFSTRNGRSSMPVSFAQVGALLLRGWGHFAFFGTKSRSCYAISARLAAISRVSSVGRVRCYSAFPGEVGIRTLKFSKLRVLTM